MTTTTTTTTTTTAPSADLMTRLSRCGFSVSKKEGDVARAQAALNLAEGNARVVLDEAIKDGRLSKAYAAAFDSGYVAAVLGYGDSVTGLAKGARAMGLADKKRTEKQQKAVAAARTARSRLCKKLNVKAASDAGRKRGTKMSPPASTSSEGPTLAESSANASQGKPRTATPAVPTLANASEMAAWMESKRAEMLAVQKKNGKTFVAKYRRVLEAMNAALED